MAKATTRAKELTEDDYEAIRRALDECTPDLPALSKRYQKRRAGFRRLTLPEIDARGDRLRVELNAKGRGR